MSSWITSKEAAEILTKNSGHVVGPAYVRQMAEKHMIRTKMLDGRTRLYWKKGIESYKVRKKGPPRKKPPVEKIEEPTTLAD